MYTFEEKFLAIPVITKHLMTGPKGNSEVCFPETRDAFFSNRKTYLSWEVLEMTEFIRQLSNGKQFNHQP